MSKNKFIQADNIKTHYLESGSGEEMILLHGGKPGVPTSCQDWEFNIDGLAKHFHVYSLDQRGFGLTDVPPTDCTHAARINHVIHFMDAIGMESAHLVGHSLGGYVSAAITIKSPKRVKSLVIVNSGTTAPLGIIDEYGRVASANARSHSFDPKSDRVFAREVLEGGIYNKELITDEMVDRWYNGFKEYPPIREEDLAIIDKVYSDPLTDGLDKISRPTLIIWGRQDEGAFLSRGLKLIELIPGARMHIFDKAGHFSYIDHHEQFNRLLIAFCLK